MEVPAVFTGRGGGLKGPKTSPKSPKTSLGVFIGGAEGVEAAGKSENLSKEKESNCEFWTGGEERKSENSSSSSTWFDGANNCSVGGALNPVDD